MFADASGLSPLRIDRIVDAAAEDDEIGATDIDDADRRRTRIDPFRSDHPATRQLTDDKQLDLADAVIRRRFQFVTGETTKALSVLLNLNNGQPLAAENFVGRGRVIVQAVPLRLQWSDLARTQSFVVMVRDWIDYLAQPRATQYNLQPGEPIVMRLLESASSGSLLKKGSDPLETLLTHGKKKSERVRPLFQQAANEASSLPTEASTAILRTPQGDAIELTANQRDDAFEFRSSRTRLPGEYRLEIGLADEAIPFQVLRDAGESNLDALSPDAQQQIAASTTASPTLERVSATASTQSDPLWPYLLIGLIVLITGELVLSGVLARERFGSAGIPEFSEMDAPLLGPTTGSAISGRSDTAQRGALVGSITSEVN